jgi:hypothetical protein
LLTERSLVGNIDLLRRSKLLLLICHYDDDLGWTKSQPFDFVIYEKKSPQGKHAVHFNKGNEVSAYIKFIVDYYDSLPERVLFLHGHRVSRHQRDILTILMHFASNVSFTPLPTANRSAERPRLYTLGDYHSINHFVWHCCRSGYLPYIRLQEQWHWLGRWLGDLPDSLLGFCCSQFVVTRAAIHRQPKEFYVEVLHQIQTLSGEDASFEFGAFFEYIWHYIFGMPAIDTSLASVEAHLDPQKLTFLGNAVLPPVAQTALP